MCPYMVASSYKPHEICIHAQCHGIYKYLAMNLYAIISCTGCTS